MKRKLMISGLLLGFILLLNYNGEVFANNTTIEEGIYEISSCIDNSKVINVENSNNVDIYERQNKENQKFKILLNEDGTYTFIAMHSNKALDVVGAGTNNGTNIHQYESNKTDAQKWIIQKNEDDTYSMISKCNGLYIDIAGASSQNGANIQMYTGNGTNAQKFKFFKVQDTKGEKTIEDGIYNIYSQVADNRVLEIPNNDTKNETVLKTATNNNMANQKFKITYHKDGTYSITLVHSKKALDVKSASQRNGTPVQQYENNETDAQKWIIKKNEDDTYSIISKSNGLALDICSANTSVGASLQTYYFNGTKAQRFIFKACESLKGTQSAKDGTYRILSNVNSIKAFDVKEATTANGGVIQIWDSTRVTQQKFEIEYVGEGYYKIKAKISNKVLTVKNENPKVGSKITQQEDKNLDTQKWILKKYSESLYAIISKCGNLYMDIGSANANNGQDLQLNTETDFTQQQFILINEKPETNGSQIEDGVYQIQLKSNRVLDVAEGSYNNTANIQIWEKSKVLQQRFHITRVNNTNYYKMTAVHSAKVIDVQGGNYKFGANINQYEANGTDNQYWVLQDCGDGYYNIISKANGLCIDVQSGYISQNGANVQLYYDNGTDAQKFKFIPINIIDNDTYEIETKLNSNRILDVSDASTQEGANIQIWTADNVDQQRFILTALTTDTYKITAKHSNKALTVDTNTNNVYQSTYSDAENQKWKIIEAGDGYYSLACKANGKVLDVSGALAKDGQNIQVYSANNTDAQKFRFVKGLRKFYEEGTYGRTGLAIARDGRGSNLKYYRYGKGTKVLFATFSIHGFEDSYHHDGAELTYMAEEFKNYLENHIDASIIRNWTIYIFPCLNPDGQIYGYTNNGPGRNSLFSAAPGNKGIDMNRNWSVGYKSETSDRNYNGTEPFQAYEAASLRDFILNRQGTSNILVDTHGWLNETIGDDRLGSYYRNQFGLPTHINSYGSGYLVNWARTLRNGRSVLVELPEVKSHNQTVSWNYAQKYSNATMQMLREN